MLGKRIINTATGAAPSACTTDTVQILGDTSCVAYYKMSDATDETGSYDGTPTNVNFNVAGKFGNAGEFNGSNKIVIPSAFGLITSNSSFTWSSWINLDSVYTSGIRALVGHQTSARSGLAVYMYGTNSGITLSLERFYGNTFRYSSTYNTTAGLFNYSANTWYHLAIVYDGSTSNASVYVNGTQAGSTYNLDVTGATITTTNETTIGLVNGISGFQGKIDQIRIFDRAITANEVTTLYNEVYCQPTIVPTDHFEPVIYTGNGSSQSISTLDFQPDLVWIKRRDVSANHRILDSVRGADLEIYPNLTNAEGDFTTLNWSFDSNGFSFNTSDLSYNALNGTYVTWNFKAGGADVQNTDGTITSQVSANVDAGFSIVSYTANATSGATIGHGLDQELDLLIVKSRNLGQAWNVYVKDVTDTSAKYLRLNETFSIPDLITVNPRFIPNNFTDSVFSVGNDNATNGISGTDTYIAYCFHSVDGMSRIGSYVGTGAASGNSIVTGFRPAFVMIKPTSLADNWLIYDNKRGNDIALFANLTNGDTTYAGRLELNSNGFTINTSNSGWNGNNASYIFMAFAEENVQPQPVLANSFNTVTYTGNGGTQAINTVGFQPDLIWIKDRDTTGESHRLNDSVRGVGKPLYSNGTFAEGSEGSTGLTAFDSNGFSIGNATAYNNLSKKYVAWCFKASNESTINQEGSITSIVSANPAAGFSVVKQNSNNTNDTYGHGLDEAPEMIISKNMDVSGAWGVYHKDLGTGKFLYLNQTNSVGTSANVYPIVNDTVFSGGSTGWNNLNYNYINYCFHSVDGFSKIGSYTSTYPSTTFVYVGFRPRFVMIKCHNQPSRHWIMHDSARGTDEQLYANLSFAEANSGTSIQFTSTGFYINGGGNDLAGGSSYSYIYLAIKAN